MDETRGEKTTIDVGVIAPCDKWRNCKIPKTAIGGQFVVERMGHAYWSGTVFCLRCKHHKPADLFEDKDTDFIMKDPQADQIVGVDEEIILEALLT